MKSARRMDPGDLLVGNDGCPSSEAAAIVMRGPRAPRSGDLQDGGGDALLEKVKAADTLAKNTVTQFGDPAAAIEKRNRGIAATKSSQQFGREEERE